MKGANEWMKWKHHYLAVLLAVCGLVPGVPALIRTVRRNTLAITCAKALLGSADSPVTLDFPLLGRETDWRESIEAPEAFLAGLYWWRQGETERAEQAFRQGGAQGISRALAVARGYGQRGALETAFSLLEVIEKAAPGLGDVDCIRGALYRTTGDRARAIRAYEHAASASRFLGLECGDAHSVRAALATLYLERNAWEAARTHCAALLDSPVYRGFALACMGRTTFRLQRTSEAAAEAAAYLDTALAEGPRNLQAYLEMAYIYRATRQYSLAEGVLQRGLEVFQLPRVRPVRYVPVQEKRWYILVSYGQTLLAEGRIGEAIDRLEEAIEIGRFRWDAGLWLGRAYLADRRCSEARQEFDILLRRWPNIGSRVKDDLEKLEKISKENECR